jgi:hypothetical protein
VYENMRVAYVLSVLGFLVVLCAVVFIVLSPSKDEPEAPSIQIESAPPSFYAVPEEELEKKNEATSEANESSPEHGEVIDYEYLKEGNSETNNCRIKIIHASKAAWAPDPASSQEQNFVSKYGIPITTGQLPPPIDDSYEQTQSYVSRQEELRQKGWWDLSIPIYNPEESRMEEVVVLEADMKPLKMKYGGSAVGISISAEGVNENSESTPITWIALWIFRGDYIYMVEVTCTGETLSLRTKEELIYFFTENLYFDN